MPKFKTLDPPLRVFVFTKSLPVGLDTGSPTPHNLVRGPNPFVKPVRMVRFRNLAW